MTQIQQQQNPQLIKNTTRSTTRQITTTEITMTQMITRTNTAQLLYVACQGHPPLWIIQTLCACGPTAMDFVPKNAFRHTPLHVAAAWGARPEVVQYLTQIQPDTAQWQDGLVRPCALTFTHTRRTKSAKSVKLWPCTNYGIWWGGSS
jgi:hypothetical protein